MSFSKYLALPMRIFIASVFILSGFTKLMEPFPVFFNAMQGYQLVRGPVAAVAAHIMPWVELIAGVLFLTGLWTRPSLICLWLMNNAFLFAIASVWVRKIPLENCGCFGENFIHLKLPQVFLLDVVLWCFFLLLYLNERQNFFATLDSFIEKDSG